MGYIKREPGQCLGVVHRDGFKEQCREPRWLHPELGLLAVCREHGEAIFRGDVKPPPLRQGRDYQFSVRRSLVVDPGVPPRPAVALDRAEEFIERLETMPQEGLRGHDDFLRQVAPERELETLPIRYVVGPNPDDLAVWWLDNAAIEIVLDDMNVELPGYIWNQVRSMDGRNLRGRLWEASPEFGASIDPDRFEETALGRSLQRMGGLVMWRQDLGYLVGMPGIVTDLELRRLANPGSSRS